MKVLIEEAQVDYGVNHKLAWPMVCDLTACVE